MKKMKDILPEVEASSSEECLVCECHDRAYELLPENIECPYCNEKVCPEIANYEVVGHSNYYDPNHEIAKYPTFSCTHCGKDIALFPTKIKYNANHDIYYTGGADYLEDDENEIFIKAQNLIEKSLKKWDERIKAGENIDAFFPALWIKRDITKAISEYLYEKGFKK